MIAKKRGKKNKKASKKPVLFLVFGIIFLAIGGLLVYSNFRVAQRRQELSSRIRELSGEINDLELENEKLKTSLGSVLDEVSLEKQARENFQLQKPGEKVVVVVGAPSPSPEVDVDRSESWWQKIIDKLGL